MRRILEAVGDNLHYAGCEVAALPESEYPDLFRFTAQELDDLQGPVARMVARHAVLARVAKATDETTVALYLGRYVLRNATDARAAVNIENAKVGPVARPESEGGEHGDERGETASVRSGSG